MKMFLLFLIVAIVALVLWTRPKRTEVINFSTFGVNCSLSTIEHRDGSSKLDWKCDD